MVVRGKVLVNELTDLFVGLTKNGLRKSCSLRFFFFFGWMGMNIVSIPKKKKKRVRSGIGSIELLV